MSPLFETIRIENGLPRYLEWHERRMERARAEIWQEHAPVNLAPLINVPPEFSIGMVRCNIMYGPGILDLSFKQYKKQVIRSLKLVFCDPIDYHLKYADRSQLETLFDRRAECDEIIIVNNDLITDTSMSNIIFSDGKNWFTPARPLLRGTCRERLMACGWMAERDIRAGEINTFTEARLINALRYPDEELPVPVSQIFY